MYAYVYIYIYIIYIYIYIRPGSTQAPASGRNFNHFEHYFQIEEMLEDLVASARGVGLEIHMGKTKVLTNEDTNKSSSLRINGCKDVEILKGSASTEYLGRKLCFGALHDTEVDARLDKAWRKFFSFKSELCSRHVWLTSRLKLFNAVATPTFLYGGGTWTLTASRESKIRTTQRKIDRKSVG